MGKTAKKHPLLAWRERQGLSQREAAHLARVHEQTWFRWERRLFAPRERQIYRLTALTGMKAGQLMGLE